MNFNPRTPCGVRQPFRWRLSAATDFNPRTPCGVRPDEDDSDEADDEISIHAPLAGCDRDLPLDARRASISIHASLAGCDVAPSTRDGSTVPNFNPRTPCGVRPAKTFDGDAIPRFQSTHPLRGATPSRSRNTSVSRFQSTHPLRGATCARDKLIREPRISIHAPLAGCDRRSLIGIITQTDFNPRTPCGVRPVVLRLRVYQIDFNPRTPCGVRPVSGFLARRCPLISIHAPLAGCDNSCIRKRRSLIGNFNPRTPCGVRQQNCRNIPGKFAQKLQNFCKAEQRAALPRVGQRESGRYFRPCAVRTSRGKPERFRFASDNERALRSVARLCAEVFDAGFILVSKVIKA